MPNEKLRILEMIKDGTISPQEGLDLIQALEQSEKSLVRATPDQSLPGITRPQSESANDSGGSGSSKRKPHWLYIKVNDEDGKNVNIKIPISLAKFAGKFIPKDAKAEMSAQGIDLDVDGILKVLEDEGPMNLIEVNDEDGKSVRIYTE
jgi:DUF4097 and DUF4098 domain-containing protein YvlB